MRYLITILLLLIPIKHINGGVKKETVIEEIIRIKELKIEVLKSKIRIGIAELKYKE